MILIKDNTKSNIIYVPKHVFSDSMLFDIQLIGLLNNCEYVKNVMNEKNYDFYYVFEIDLTDLPDLEYVYYVKDGCKCVSKGLLRIGDVSTDISKHYEPEINKIKYYE